LYRYKRIIKKHKEMQQPISKRNADTKSHHNYNDNNKVHISICLFFAFWLVASVNWL
jgi:hypothetical protein